MLNPGLDAPHGRPPAPRSLLGDGRRDGWPSSHTGAAQRRAGGERGLCASGAGTPRGCTRRLSRRGCEERGKAASQARASRCSCECLRGPEDEQHAVGSPYGVGGGLCSGRGLQHSFSSLYVSILFISFTISRYHFYNLKML